jgi:hypothetical protein
MYLGRHFLMTPIGITLPPRIYTLALCMSPPIKEFTKAMIARLED